MQRSLQQYREQLDAIDAHLLDLLAERLGVTRAVAQLKHSKGTRLRDRQREAALLARLQESARGRGIPADMVARVFQEVLNLSFHDQIATAGGLPHGARVTRVGYQGVPGAYSERAATLLMSARRKQARPIGYPTFRAVAEAVHDGINTYGVLPVENSLAGSIHDTYDQIKRYGLCIIGEDVMRIEHCLAAVREAPLHEVTRIFSHPQALAQCSSFLSSLPAAKACPYFDTASAMEKVAADQDPTAGAIAGEHAAQRYGLVVLQRDIADHPENYTRFLLVAARHAPVPRGAASKTSLMFALPHREGALLTALNIMHRFGVNLTKLESRPRPGAPWRYDFYVDFEGNRTDAAVKRMLAALGEAAVEIRILGSYPSRTVSEGRPVTDDEIRRSREQKKGGAKPPGAK